MHKKNFLLLIILLSAGFVNAQETEKSRSIKLYVNGYSYRQWTPAHSFHFTENIKESGFGRISLALKTRKKQHWSHEFELSFPHIRHKTQWTSSEHEGAVYMTEGWSIIRINTNGRYQLNYHFYADEKTWSPYLGAGTGLNYRGLFFSPSVSLYYPEAHQQLIVPLEIIPGLMINFHQHFALDINLPLQLHQFIFEFNRLSNPTLPIRFQRVTDFYGVVLPKSFQFRIGLVYKL
ncbi:MAG: hypothetical protein ACQES0_11305 [Bacteroidota bacterium]